MKCARLNDRIIHLHTYSREHYQFLFEEGIKGHLFCSHCEKPVLLRLNIADPPEFIHRQMYDFPACEEARNETRQRGKKKMIRIWCYSFAKGKRSLLTRLQLSRNGTVQEALNPEHHLCQKQ